ncbi:MAG TPA: hypothetical protein PKO15_16840 [Fibrobacteria bacterium]|nr:hypothetical protein [Fibrobacteria bacterium]HOX51157.1 hypothetical protein [Fibrobacteria bacterium]
MREPTRAGLWGIAFLLAGCGGDAPANLGGGATETDNVVRLHVGARDGRHLPGTRVVFVRTDTWLSDVARGDGPRTYQALSDSLGEVRMALPTGRWSAQAQTDSQGAILPLETTESPQSMVLGPLSTLRIRLSGRPVASLRVAGTAWEGLTDSVGTWTFRLPAGTRAIVARTGDDLSPAAAVVLRDGQDLDTTATVVSGRVVLDDFTSGTAKTSVAAYVGAGTWFSNEWGTRIGSEEDSTGPSFRGKMSLRYTAPDTANAALVGIVFRDREGFRPLDLSGLDSICVELRGNGEVRMFVIQYDQDGTWLRSADAFLAVDSTWRKRCVAPSDMHDPWDPVKTRANTLAWLAKRGDWLELRAPVLWGASLQDLSR